MAIDDDVTRLPEEGPEDRGSLHPGQQFGQYKIIRLLGRGGMGEVYEVEHWDLGTRHALKLIHPEIVSRSDSAERFRREAKVMAQLRHEHIVHVDDFSQQGGKTWLRMELVTGGSLEEKMRAADGAMPEAEVRELLTQVLEGLKAAHGSGAVHRDLKPANILIDEEGCAKIADFGLVRLAGEQWVQSQVQQTVARSMTMGSAPTEVEGESGSGGTSTKALLGTFAYMSPEQKRGEEADALSDLYSVGLMAFQMLTGEEQVGFDLPSDLVEGLDPAWDDWIRKAVAPQANRRFGDAAVMREAVPANELPNMVPAIKQPAGGIVSEPAVREEDVQEPSSERGPPRGSDWTVELPGEETLELVWIAPGSFKMGSPSGESERDDNERQHQVVLTEGYWLGKYEVTQGQWEALMGNNPSCFDEVGANAPVESVSWNEVMEFCRKLIQQERAAGRLPEGLAYTLPTEAQWEYACRAGTRTRFYTGSSDSDLSRAGWYNGNAGRKTHLVGQKQPNAWGLYDMHGNVYEWCLDRYASDYPLGTVTDPTGLASGATRVSRGGCWGDSARLCRSAYRRRYWPGFTRNYLGFRLALAPSP